MTLFGAPSVPEVELIKCTKSILGKLRFKEYVDYERRDLPIDSKS
jgi:hypothetical protein